jgi:nitrite reductase/ring-hydroxylating ferredoxin subunit
LKPTTKLLLISLLFLLLGCGKYECNNFPRVSVSLPPIYPNDVMYYNLNWAGGHENFTGGVQGIVVFRVDDWSFTAFDRACPYDWDHEDSWIWVEPDGITLKCQLCHSMFSILDGGIISGPSECPLRQYFTRFDGMILRVRS